MKISKIKDIKPAEYNPRTITDDQLENLGYAMEEFGDLSGIVINVKTNCVVGGHQRIKHFQPDDEVIKKPCADKTGTVAIGYIINKNGSRWQYREVDWSEKKEIAANIAANKHGGTFIEAEVEQLIKEIEDEVDLTLTGFSEKEIKEMLEVEDEEIKEKEIDDIETNNKCPKCDYEW